MSHKKPSALKEFEGNPGRRPINSAEPKPQKLSSLEPPAWLSAAPDDPEFATPQDVAIAVWNRIAPILDRLNILTEIDPDALGRYCEVFARWLRCKQWLDKNGESFPVYEYRWQPSKEVEGKQEYKRSLKTMRAYPQFAMYDRLMTQMNRMEAQWGIGAAARSKIIAEVTPLTELEKNAQQQAASVSPFNYAARDGIHLVKK